MKLVQNKFSKFLFANVALIGLSLFVACGGGQTTEEPGDRGIETPPVDASMTINVINRGLAELAYKPTPEGFPYKSVNVPSDSFQEWANSNKDSINKAIQQLPDGFVLQVTGHTCSIGPREAEAGKKGNIWYSTQRARNVYSALRNSGIPAEKLSYKGIADDETMSDVETTDSRNRRVTFKVVPVDNPGSDEGTN